MDENMLASLFEGEYPFFKDCNNILLYGEPGVGKSQIMNMFANKQKQYNLKFFSVNALRSQDVEMKNKTYNVLFASKEIDDMEKPNTVLILDHIDLSNEVTRKHLLMLIRDREVVDVRTDGKRKLQNEKLYILASAYPTSHFDYPVLPDEILEQFQRIKFN